jgi:hypothetical protein
MVGRRRKNGEQRIGPAINHFVSIGFKEIDARNIVDSTASKLDE